MASEARAKGVSLRTVDASDLPLIGKMLDGCGKLGNPRASTGAEVMGRLRELTDRTALEFFALEQDGACVGCAYAYDYRPADGNCKVAVVCPTADDDAWAGAARQLATYVLGRYPLHKLFCETIDEGESLRWQAAGFVVEARLAEHRFARGRYQDLIVLSRGRH